MSEKILYAYAIVPSDGPATEPVAPVPHGTGPFRIDHGDWAMIVSEVPESEYSQSSIDEHASDLEWLGTIGVGHQRVNGQLADRGDVIPLRAFTLFSDASAVERWLESERETIARVHDRLAGKLEWTLRLELAGTAWVTSPEADEIRREIDDAPSGKAYLLKKKLERELDRQRESGEDDLVRAVARDIERESGAETIVETRSSRGGADPQIDILFDRDRSDFLSELLDTISSDLQGREIHAFLTGPWPPYSFTGGLK